MMLLSQLAKISDRSHIIPLQNTVIIQNFILIVCLINISTSDPCKFTLLYMSCQKDKYIKIE